MSEDIIFELPEKQPIYADENDNLYAYYPDSGSLFMLSPRDFAGRHPLPGKIEGKGEMRMLGMFRLCT